MTACPKPTTRYQDQTEKALRTATTKRDVYRAVTLRDRNRCRVYGTYASPYAVTLLERAHHHHLVFRSAGGATTTENVCLVSAKAHDEVHRHVLRLSGNADTRDPDGTLCGVKVERPTESGWQVVAWV